MPVFETEEAKKLNPPPINYFEHFFAAEYTFQSGLDLILKYIFIFSLWKTFKLATTRTTNILFFLENLLYLITDLKGAQYLSDIGRVVKGAAIEREN